VITTKAVLQRVAVEKLPEEDAEALMIGAPPRPIPPVPFTRTSR